MHTDAGIGFPGETYGSFLADVRLDWPITRDEITLFFSGAGTLVVAPMSQDRYSVVAQLADAPSVPALPDVQRIIDARGPQTGARVVEVLWGSRFQVHHKLAGRLHDGLVMLVGDAAHVHSPAGGQGMNLGLRDAEAPRRVGRGAELWFGRCVFGLRDRATAGGDKGAQDDRPADPGGDAWQPADPVGPQPRDHCGIAASGLRRASARTLADYR